jgi:hypothetical protein
MRQTIINQIQTFLLNHNGFFHTEKEIQIHLTNYFLSTKTYDHVFFEYYVGINLLQPNYPWDNDNKISIDIVLVKDGLYYPIEIKYKTATQVFPHFVFDTETNVTLENQKAQTIGRYSFWKDIKRIELLETSFQNVKRGLVLFVSNDSSYRQAPRNNNGGAPFSIHQGRVVNIGTLLNWNDNLAVANERPGFTLRYEYNINWIQMTIPNHYYILT